MKKIIQVMDSVLGLSRGWGLAISERPNPNDFVIKKLSYLQKEVILRSVLTQPPQKSY